MFQMTLVWAKSFQKTWCIVNLLMFCEKSSKTFYMQKSCNNFPQVVWNFMYKNHAMCLQKSFETICTRILQCCRWLEYTTLHKNTTRHDHKATPTHNTISKYTTTKHTPSDFLRAPTAAHKALLEESSSRAFSSRTALILRLAWGGKRQTERARARESATERMTKREREGKTEKARESAQEQESERGRDGERERAKERARERESERERVRAMKNAIEGGRERGREGGTEKSTKKGAGGVGATEQERAVAGGGTGEGQRTRLEEVSALRDSEYIYINKFINI